VSKVLLQRTFYFAEIVCEPTKDKNQDSPLILAIKSFVDPNDLTMEDFTSLDMVTCLIEFG